MQANEAFRVEPKLVERVWGSHDLSPWYDVRSDAAIGEAWLSGDGCAVATGQHAGQTLGETLGRFPLLVKMLFPQDKLSVQVHPDDADAARLGAEAKTECWYILHADAGATVALGLKPGTEPSAVRAAIADGTLEDLIVQVPVAAGDMVYVPAGTIHAIGPGVVILEIQQNSDTTYRLYDYGRPRELHLDKGLDVLKLQTTAGKVAAQAVNGGTQLIAVPHFTVERYELAGGEHAFAAQHGAQVLVTLQGTGTLHGEGDDRDGAGVELKAGEAVIVPQGAYSVQGSAVVVRCFVP